MQERHTGLALLTAIILVLGAVSADAGTRVSGTLVGTLTDSMSVRLEWTVESLSDIEGLKVWRVVNPTVNGGAIITPDALPAVSPGSYEDLVLELEPGLNEIWYRLYAVQSGGEEVPVGGAYCEVYAMQTPVDVRTWSGIKALYK